METIVIPRNMITGEEDDKDNEDNGNLTELHFTLVNSAVDFHGHNAEEETNDSVGSDSAVIQWREVDDTRFAQHSHADLNYSRF